MKWWLSVFLSLAFLNPLGAAEKENSDPKAEKTGKEKASAKPTDEDEPKKKRTVEPFVRKAIEFPASPKKVYVVPIREDIMPPLTYIVRRGVKEAMAAKADILVIDMDTNGGRLDVTEEIMGILDKFEGLIVTYVNEKAISAGAIISFASDRIYMGPKALIGDAAPIFSGGAEIPETAAEKTKSFLTARLRAYAEENGHNSEVADAMVRMEKELVIDGQVVCEEGQLLTLTSKEASAEYGDPPQYLLSAGTVRSLDELLEKIGAGKAERTVIEATGAEKIARWINSIAPILMMIGIAGLYIEYKTPGFGVFGIIGILAFLIYFFGGYVAGISGVEWLAVFFIGVVLIMVEVFVLPGTIFIGLGGFALILASLIMAGVDMYPNMPVVPTFGSVGDSLHRSMQNMIVGFLGGILLCYALSKWLPKTSYYSAVVSMGVSGVESVARIEEEKRSRIGEVGEAVSQLRPGGKAKFGDEVIDVISAGEILEPGTPVKIVRHSGADPVVEPV
jgi:membrane-bound serine protease (ClpP class)